MSVSASLYRPSLGVKQERAQRSPASIWLRRESLSLESRRAHRGVCRVSFPHPRFVLGTGSSCGSGVTGALCFPSRPAEGDHAEPVHLHHHPGDHHSVVAPGHQLGLHEHPCVFGQRRPSHRHRLRRRRRGHRQVHQQSECQPVPGGTSGPSFLMKTSRVVTSQVLGAV